MKILLISTYELGHQPVNLAHPRAILGADGFRVECMDLAIEGFRPEQVRDAQLVAFSIPMHTAARLTVPLLARVRALKPDIHIAAYGLYATMNRDYFLSTGVDSVLGRDFEPELLTLARSLDPLRADAGQSPGVVSTVPNPRYRLPDRRDLPALDRYARVLLPDGRRKTVGYVEASRGCKHFCRHCPVVPVYDGKFRAVPRAIVLADIRQQVARGAEHITFGDPDFLNGPSHGRRLIEALHAEFPELTYDVTIKVEHILANPSLLPILRTTGCLFITSAVESLNDAVLQRLAKGHRRGDFFRLVDLLDREGLDLSPTFVPFTPWSTLDDYIDLLNAVAGLGLVDAVAPVQYSIRLLIPPGSRLLALEEVKNRVQPLQQESFLYPWISPDPRLDRLQIEVTRLVQDFAEMPRHFVFSKIWEIAHRSAGIAVPALPEVRPRRMPPMLSEPWYCCAEPSDSQYRLL